jgi:hypothetical protein
MSTIETILSVTEHSDQDYILEGIISNKPENIELSNGSGSVTRVLLQDNTGQILLIQSNDQVLNRLDKGDKILVIGAFLEEDDTGRGLRMNANGSIMKIGTAEVKLIETSTSGR